jgi:hypothetical protein
MNEDNMRFKSVGLILLVIFMGAVAIIAQQAKNPSSDVSQDTLISAKTNSISDTLAAANLETIIYYFYTDYRCPSCLKIEAYSREAIDSGFVEQLKNGQIKFEAINTDRKENAHFLDDYQLYTKSLIVAKVTDGNPAKDPKPEDRPAWKNLTKVWELLGDKKDFIKYVQSEVRAFTATK